MRFGSFHDVMTMTVVPASLTTFVIKYLVGSTLNLMTLLGLSVVVCILAGES